jgi:hypothetical protein
MAADIDVTELSDELPPHIRALFSEVNCNVSSLAESTFQLCSHSCLTFPVMWTEVLEYQALGHTKRVKHKTAWLTAPTWKCSSNPSSVTGAQLSPRMKTPALLIRQCKGWPRWSNAWANARTDMNELRSKCSTCKKADREALLSICISEI